MRLHLKQTKRRNWLLAATLLALVWGIWTAGDTVAQTTTTRAGDWVRPQRIPGYGPESLPPVLVADQDQTVHSFSSQWVGDKLAVVYSQWTPERGWTLPVDVILPPFREQARLGSVVLDDEGTFHMAFFSGDDREANIYYTRAPAVMAGQARAWSVPINVGRMAITPTVVDMELLPGGELVIVYSGRLEGQGLYAVYSSDLGETWTAPRPFYLTYDNELWPVPLDLYVDSNGRLHALWGLVDTSGNSLAIYYARLEGAQKQWTTPVIFAEAIESEADTPAIVEHDGQLIVVYHNHLPTTRWMQRSFDGGDTWTDPVRLFAHVGSNGAASFVHDSNNTLHMFFGNRVGTPIINGMWYTTWQPDEQRWREPQAVVAGPRVTGRIGGNGFDPSFARAVVVQGNILLLTWVTDPGAGRNGVWYTYTLLDTPVMPRQSLPEATPTPTPTPLPAVDSTMLEGIEGFEIEVDPASERELASSESNQRDYAQILLASTLPAGLFVILILGIFGFRIRNRV
jgi:hypothetical protein